MKAAFVSQREYGHENGISGGPPGKAFIASADII